MAQTAVFFGDIFKNTVDGQSNPRHSLTLSQRMVCLLAKVTPINGLLWPSILFLKKLCCN